MKIAEVRIDYEDGSNKVLKGKLAAKFVNLFLLTPTKPKRVKGIAITWHQSPGSPRD